MPQRTELVIQCDLVFQSRGDTPRTDVHPHHNITEAASDVNTLGLTWKKPVPDPPDQMALYRFLNLFLLDESR